MAQVVTPDNLVELHTTGKVAPFVPPTAASASDATSTAPAGDSKAAADAAEPSTTVGEDGKKQVRGPDGKFQAADKTGEAPVDEDDETENLTESVRKKIGKQVRRRKEAEEFARQRDSDAEAARAEAARLRAELEAARGKKSSGGPASVEGKPKMEDFKTVGEYAEAVAEWKVEQKATEARENHAQNSRQAETQARVTAFVEAQAEFQKTHPDYVEVLESVDDDEMPPAAMNYFVENPDVGPALAYHLAKNPSEIQRLRKLPPTRVIAELGKLEDKLAKPVTTPPSIADTTRQPARTSKAPAPVQPIDTSDAPAVEKDPSKMTFQELRAFRLAQRAAKT